MAYFASTPDSTKPAAFNAWPSLMYSSLNFMVSILFAIPFCPCFADTL